MFAKIQTVYVLKRLIHEEHHLMIYIYIHIYIYTYIHIYIYTYFPKNKNRRPPCDKLKQRCSYRENISRFVRVRKTSVCIHTRKILEAKTPHMKFKNASYKCDMTDSQTEKAHPLFPYADGNVVPPLSG